MGLNISRVEYFHTTVQDRPGEAYNMLESLAGLNVNLLAFTAVPVGPDRTQLTLCPESAISFAHIAASGGLTLDGPHYALLVQGDDGLGALARVHEKLYDAGVNVYASSGVTDGKGSFGYLIYVRPDSFDAAAEALGLGV
jgi:hypothetical protein